MSKREVVITGISVLSPIGIDADSYWNSLVEGRSGVSYLSLHTELERRPIGSETPDFRPKDYIKPKKNVKVMSRDIQMGVVAALLACRDSNLVLEGDLEARSIDPERIGSVFGCDLIGAELDALKDALRAGVTPDGKYDFKTWGTASMENIMPLWMLKTLPNMVASHVAIALDARGPNNTLTLDRGSSLCAIMEACRIIERGAADIMIAGGVGNKINPSILSRGIAYSLAPWSEDPSENPRPFDANRKGTVMGEGSAAFVLETKEHAEARGAKIYAKVLGYAEALDPTANFGIRQEAIEKALRLALERGDRTVDDLGHVNANAIGVSDDAIEAQGLKNVVGDTPVFSACGYFGNIGSGAGAIELVASLLAIQKGILPATRNCEQIADDCPINVARKASTELKKSTFVKVNHTNSGRSFALLLE